MMVLFAMIAAAASGPAYLECSLTGGNGAPLAVEVMADEASQKLTIALPSTGYTATLAARFTPSAVEAFDAPLTWHIDRRTLAISREWRSGGSSAETGKCRLAPIPATRAF